MGKKMKSGELRALLCESIVRVSEGKMASDDARNIGKLAAQVTENLYAEAKIAALQVELGRTAASFGGLELTTESVE